MESAVASRCLSVLSLPEPFPPPMDLNLDVGSCPFSRAPNSKKTPKKKVINILSLFTIKKILNKLINKDLTPVIRKLILQFAQEFFENSSELRFCIFCSLENLLVCNRVVFFTDTNIRNYANRKYR